MKEHRTAVILKASSSASEDFKERVQRFAESAVNGNNIKVDFYTAVNDSIYEDLVYLDGTPGGPIERFTKSAGYVMTVILEPVEAEEGVEI